MMEIRGVYINTVNTRENYKRRFRKCMDKMVKNERVVGVDFGRFWLTLFLMFDYSVLDYKVVS